MRLILLLLFSFSFALVALVSAQKTGEQNPFEPEIRRYEAEDAIHPPAKGGILFVGSSSIARWTTLREDFSGYNVLNRGFGGSQISDSVYFADRIVIPYAPRMIIFFAGTNDLAGGKSAATVFEDYKRFVSKVRQALPKVVIAYISISPAPSRWANLDRVKEANRLIKGYALDHPKLLFVDVFSEMLTKDGGPRPELFVSDRLHLNSQGYAIWVKAIKKILPPVRG